MFITWYQSKVLTDKKNKTKSQSVVGGCFKPLYGVYRSVCFRTLWVWTWGVYLTGTRSDSLSPPPGAVPSRRVATLNAIHFCYYYRTLRSTDTESGGSRTELIPLQPVQRDQSSFISAWRHGRPRRVTWQPALSAAPPTCDATEGGEDVRQQQQQLVGR